MVANRLASAATSGRHARLHPQTATRVSSWAALNFGRAAGGYKGPDALFLLLFGGDARFMGRCKRLKIRSRVRCV